MITQQQLAEAVWRFDRDYKVWNLYAHGEDSAILLAWLKQRPNYCDRGHWGAHIECWTADNPPDGSDGWPHHYMDENIGMMEIRAFLFWRLFKVRWERQQGMLVDPRILKNLRKQHELLMREPFPQPGNEETGQCQQSPTATAAPASQT